MAERCEGCEPEVMYKTKAIRNMIFFRPWMTSHVLWAHLNLVFVAIQHHHMFWSLRDRKRRRRRTKRKGGRGGRRLRRKVTFSLTCTCWELPRVGPNPESHVGLRAQISCGLVEPEGWQTVVCNLILSSEIHLGLLRFCYSNLGFYLFVYQRFINCTKL
jgi:hypothetical protein